MPPIQPLINAQIRDAVITIDHDGRYYMTGSTGDDIWKKNDGVELWVSSDLKKLGLHGLSLDLRPCRHMQQAPQLC